MCSNEAGDYASSSIATGRVSQTSQVSAEHPDKEWPITRGQGRLLRRLPTSLGEHTTKSKCGPPGWGLGMRLTSASQKMIMLRSPK
jgi:hypothetical protein